MTVCLFQAPRENEWLAGISWVTLVEPGIGQAYVPFGVSSNYGLPPTELTFSKHWVKSRDELSLVKWNPVSSRLPLSLRSQGNALMVTLLLMAMK